MDLFFLHVFVRLCLHLSDILQVIGRNYGEDTLAHWPTASSSMTVDEASFEILKYLESGWSSLSSSGSSLFLLMR